MKPLIYLISSLILLLSITPWNALGGDTDLTPTSAGVALRPLLNPPGMTQKINQAVTPATSPDCPPDGKPASPTPTDPKLLHLFENPLLIGPSITQEINGVISPGRRLAVQFGVGDHVVKVTQGGVSGSTLIGRLTDKHLQQASVIIGVDLFFWDTTQRNCESGKKAVRDFIRRTSEAHVPVVIGNVPVLKSRLLLKFTQPCTDEIDQEISENCTEKTDCKILDLVRLDDLAKKHGGDFSYFSDGIHLSEKGSKAVSEELLRLLQDRK